jgi:FkbM family methyltransferase
VWGASWYNEAQTRQKATLRLDRGDIEEAEAILAADDSVAAQAIKNFCQYARTARIAALAAAKHSALSDHVKIYSQRPFELLKTTFALLAEDPDTLVWQIGAADGILVDPLRPLLVNFDMPSVLLEPNPYLFKALTKNYAGNRRTKLLNAAFDRTAGTLMLNAVNPLKSRENGLPDWAMGVSSAFNDRNAIGGKTIDLETTRLINECVEAILVTTVDVECLLRLNGGRHPAIVVVDAEGMDFIVVEAIIRFGLRPTVLQYEVQCLPPEERQQIVDLLANEYVVMSFGKDSIAYKREFFASYCDRLYIQNGVSTIYGEALKLAVSL